MGGEVHQYVGEEAVAVGVCSALRLDDVITSTHRGHGHIIAKGGDLRRMMAELGGKRDGYCRGKGGSMHITAVELGIYGANGIVGGGVPHAVGSGCSRPSYLGQGTVAVAFFGDGASNQGVVHEAMNLASIYDLPVIFVCENNHYAVSFGVEHSTSARHISDRAIGYSMPGMTVDGMDVLAVRAATDDAVTRARAGEGPTLIEADTYRYYGHFSHEEMLLAKPYRTKEEIESWRAKDPIARFTEHLVESGIPQERIVELERSVDRAIAEAIAFMKASPDPDPETAYEDVYAVYEPALRVRGW